MSCETENIEYWRLVNKYTTISGVGPTIPPSQDHNDGTWNATDIYIGELFINTTDDKIWMRTENGIRQISGTGGTGSTINDYVSASMGGTFSGPIYAPTMSANGMTAFIISASAFDGLYFGSSASTFYGDGSNLTGINVEWNGGTVSNPTYFANQVELGDVILNGPISTGNSYIEIVDDVWVSGGVSASYFVGDGSLLTGIIAATGPNYYTDAATLVGATIVFDRTDATGAYSVDLSPIISTQSINTFTWDNTTNLLELTTIGGSSFQILINTFNDLAITNGITADTVTANNFYGTFTGAFTDDVYTTNAELDGTTAVFYRTDGASYSLDLSPISSTASGTGATQSLAQTLVYGNQTDGYDINLNAGDLIINDNGQQTIRFQETGILAQNKYTTSEYIYNGFLEVRNDVSTSQLAHIRTDLTSGDKITTGVQIDDTTATITSNNETTSNQAFVRADSGSGTSPQAEVRLWALDTYGNVSYMNMNPGVIQVVGYSNDGFSGIEYGDDYSADYTNRSLVDKEYVDNAISGGGITYSGSADYTTFFDSDNSLNYTDTYYNSGRYTVGHYTGTPWVYDHAGKFNVYSPYSLQPAIIAEGGQFGGLFIASDNTAGGQLIGLQAEAYGSQISGNLGLYSKANGTQSANTGAQFVAYNGVVYPGYGDVSNTGLYIDVYSGGVDPSIAGLTNSGIQLIVSGRAGDNNYIGQFQDGSEGVGKVLTCIDATGLATWQTPTGGTSSTPNLTEVLAVGATANAWINLGQTYGIRETGATGSAFRFLSTRSFWNTGAGLNSSAISLYKSGEVVIESSNGIDGVTFTLHDSGTIYSGGVSQDGIQYAADYSAGYTTRSLVDKEYVDNAISGITGSGTWNGGTVSNPTTFTSPTFSFTGLTTTNVTIGTASPQPFGGKFVLGMGTNGKVEKLNISEYLPARTTTNNAAGTSVIMTTPWYDAANDFFEYKYTATKLTSGLSVLGRMVGTLTVFSNADGSLINFSQTGPTPQGDVSGLTFDFTSSGGFLEAKAIVSAGTDTFYIVLHLNAYRSGFYE